MSSNLKQPIKALQQERARAEANARERLLRARDPRFNRILEQFPDEGPFRRELYLRHMEFFACGAEEVERCFMAGNRVGKTRAGACEMAWHLTGEYPAWWEGKRFDRPIQAWACGSTIQTTRDIVQAELLGIMGPNPTTGPGDIVGLGTGMIPRKNILRVRKRTGSVADAIERAYIQHKSGGTSVLGFKTYQQGRESFQGTAKQCIWVDEECPFDVYLECLMRLLTTKGIIWLTYTPLNGLTDVTLRFLPAATLN